MVDVDNYGSVLQTFATQTILQRMGCECDIINYAYPNRWHFKHGYPKIGNKFLENIRYIFVMLGLKSELPSNKKEFKNFRHNQLNLTKRFKNLNSLEKYNWKKYDAIIAGSDQIWNPKFMKGDKTFLLSFVPSEIPKISISSSFASKSIDAEFKSSYKKNLSDFKSLSVRDHNGIEIIRDLGITTPVEMVLDPTLLVSVDDWLKLLNINHGKDKQPYILVYNLNYAVKSKEYIYRVAEYFHKKLNLKVIFTGNINEAMIGAYSDYEIRSYPAVDEFVKLFSDSSMVITTSFHGTSYALNFNKPLCAIVPSNGDDRQISLLRDLGAENCATPISLDFEKINPYYEATDVNENLNALRQRCLEWIANQI